VTEMDRGFVSLLEEVEEPTAPSPVKFIDITGSCLMTPRRNKFIHLVVCLMTGPKRLPKRALLDPELPL